MFLKYLLTVKVFVSKNTILKGFYATKMKNIKYIKRMYIIFFFLEAKMLKILLN